MMSFMSCCKCRFLRLLMTLQQDFFKVSLVILTMFVNKWNNSVTATKSISYINVIHGTFYPIITCVGKVLLWFHDQKLIIAY